MQQKNGDTQLATVIYAQNSGMNTYEFLLGNVFWLTAARFATRILTILVLPIRTAYLSPQDFGIIAMFAVSSSFLGGLFGMGVVSFAGRVIYKYERTDKRKCKEKLGTILIYLICFSLIGALISSLFIKDLFGLVFKDIVLPHPIFYYLPVIMAFIAAVHGFSSNSLLNLQLNKKMFSLEISLFTLIIPTQVIGLVFFSFSVWDVIILQLIAQAIVLLLGFWMIRDWLSFAGSLSKIFKEAMRYSTPMALLNIAGWFQESIDKVLLSKIVTLNAVGLYSAGISIATNYSFLSRPIATSLKPEISKRLDASDPNIQKQIRDFFMLFFQFSNFLYLAVSLFSKEIVEILMDVRFHECYRIIPIVVLGLIFGELNGIFHLKFIFRNKTIWFPISTVLAAIISSSLNYLLIPSYDIYGAAFAGSATALLIMFFCYVVSQRLHRSEYSLFINFMPLLVSIGLIFAIDSSGLGRLGLFILKVIIVVVYGIGLDYCLRKANISYQEVRNVIIRKVRKIDLFFKNIS